MDGDRSNERPGCSTREDTAEEDSDYLEKEINVVDDENDDDPAQALHLTLSTRCRPTPNEQTVPTSSTNNLNLIVPCTIDAASGGSGWVSFAQRIPHHLLRELHQPHLQSVQPFAIPRGLPSTVRHPLYFQLQDHLQRSLLHPIPQNFPPRAHQTPFHLRQGALSSGAVGDTTAASAAAQQQCQKHIQLQSPIQPQVVPALRFLPPLAHSWLSMHAPSPLLVTQEQKPSSKWNLASRTQSSANDTEPNPVQLISLDEMQRFMETFRNVRITLGFTRARVVAEFSEMYGKGITKTRLRDFEDFYNFFKKNYEKFRTLLERWEEEFPSMRIHCSSLTRPEPVVRDPETQATTATTSTQVPESALSQKPKLSGEAIAMLNCDSGIDDDLSNDRPDSKTAEEKPDQHPHEDSNERRQEMKVMSPQHLEREPHHQDLQSVQPIALPRGLPSTMQHQRFIRLPTERNAEQLKNLEELQQFVKTFRNFRLKLGFSQEDVASQLGGVFSFRVISRFENFDHTFENMCKFKPLLEHYLQVKYALQRWSVNMSESCLRNRVPRRKTQNPEVD